MEKFLNLIFVLMLVLIYSCTDQIINTVVENGEVNRVNKMLMPSDSSMINPDKPLCGTKDVTMWLFDHYEPKAGKILGIWPGSVSQSLWLEYRNIWGFSQVRVSNSSEYSTAINAGYSSTNIFLQISNYSNYQSLINSINAQYYIDEPIERGAFSVGQLIEIANYILNNRPGSKLYMSTYHYNPYLGPRYEYIDVLNQTNNSYVMCDQYDGDQRNLWSGFRNYVEARNPSNFIHTIRDGVDEFSQLLGHANNIGVNSLLLYIGSDGDPNNVDDFCWDAWANGSLRRFERKYVYEYHCLYPDPCDCDPNSNYGWYLYKIWTFNDIREVVY